MCSRCDQPKNVTNRVAFLESFNQLIYATLSTVKESSSVWRHSAYLPRSYFLDGKEEENTGKTSEGQMFSLSDVSVLSMLPLVLPFSNLS